MATQRSITRELLAATADDDLDSLFTEYVFALQEDDPDKLDSLPIAIQAVFIVAGLDADVLNGGFNQYLFNSPDFAQDAPAALLQLGLHDAASLAQSALERFDATVQAQHATARKLGTVEAFTATYENQPFSELDEAYYASSDRWRAERISFIRQHSEQFLHS